MPATAVPVPATDVPVPATDVPVPATDSVVRRVRLRTASQLTILLFCVLFFQGCQKSTIRFTIGPFAPVVALEYNGDEPLASEFEAFSPHWLVLNFVVLGILFFASPVARWTARQGSCRELTIAVFCAAALFNSILISVPVWQQLVFRPIAEIDGAIHWMLRLSSESPTAPFFRGLSSRLYFVFCVISAIAVWRLTRMVMRRYVFTDPDRWWQVSLGPLLTITLVLGTGLGMLLRLWR